MPKRSFNKRSIADKILKGDIRSASKLLTLIEDRDPAAVPVLETLYPHTGHAALIGVTGPAGAGKSALINHLISAFRQKKKSVGVLAIDPSSPLSGGALLGDRLRMRDHLTDKEVFIRSLATRGAWGALSYALFDAVHALDALGKDILFIETVGAGQDEVQIAQLAETVLLILSPGLGDEVQILKAGLLEIGDIVVVNKGDLPEAKSLYRQIREWTRDRPVLLTSASKEEGLSALVSVIEKRSLQKENLTTRKSHFVREELLSRLREAFMESLPPFSEEEIEAIRLRRENPYSFIRAWLKKGAVKNSF